jgi:hypothetical protein
MRKRNLVNLHVYVSQTVKKKCMKPVMVVTSQRFINNGLSVISNSAFNFNYLHALVS